MNITLCDILTHLSNIQILGSLWMHMFRKWNCSE